MPEIDLGPVIGPQGPKGDTGPQGEQGPQGPQGPAGKFDMDAGLTFSEASARANINSGESLKTILGKIKKYFTDLKPHAFKAPANNFTTTDATTAAAAPTVKQLKEDYDALNSALVRGTETFNNITIDGTPYSGECTCYTFTIPSAGMQFARIFTTDNDDLWGGYVDGGKLIYRHQSSAGIWLPWQTM